MMKNVEPKYDVGVIVGRFQTHALHAAHRELIASVCSRHPKVIILLGLSAVKVPTRNNPLDFEARKQMILEKFPGVIVMYVKDQRGDREWSAELDVRISDLVTPTQSVVLYGGRDSFIGHYKGRYPTQELMQTVFVSGSEVRSNLSKHVRDTSEFRAGVIWGAYNQYPRCFPTVDIALFNEDYTKILLARKPGEDLHRFVGGFADPGSVSHEDDARREVSEETGLEISEPQYIGSRRIDDWRYRNETDCIKTTLFAATVSFGCPTAGDDICELRWFDWNETISTATVMPEHRTLFEMLKNWYTLTKKGKRS